MKISLMLFSLRCESLSSLMPVGASFSSKGHDKYSTSIQVSSCYNTGSIRDDLVLDLQEEQFRTNKAIYCINGILV